ncbi:MAG: hypothetical protein NC044_05680 [Prevotella sp.]|nr:hypothetical protein [Bacteroides sp.]MCM1445878.1 hypothetical protein [Prevotella sp.]
MSRRRAYSDTTIGIMQRYYEAFDAAKDSKRIKSITKFCDENGIDKRHFYAQRKDLGKGFFEVGWLVPLIRDCGVSSAWLLTGIGSMFNA